MVMGFLSRFVDSNDREVRRIQPLVDAANALEPELERESDAEIRARVDEIRAELAELQATFGPSRDELEQDEPERRRDLEKARRTKENERLQAALDDSPARGVRGDPRGDAANARRCATSTSS